MNLNPAKLHPPFVRTACLHAVAFLVLSLSAFAQVKSLPARKFDVPSGLAEDTLKVFSQESGRGVIAGTELVSGVRTNAVQGLFTPRDALDRMLVGTGLKAAGDDQTGAFALRRGESSSGFPPPVPSSGQHSPSADQAVVLGPFDVQANTDKGYASLNSNSITAFNAQLDQLPISADMFDQTFMDDVGATSVEALVTGNSAGAGFGTPNAATNAVFNQPWDSVQNGSLEFRGLTAGYPIRDSLLPVGTPTQPGGTGVGFTSNFDVERVEIINGPQALLYGDVGAGGVLNLVSKQARIGAPAFGSVTYKIDQYGSKSALLDYGGGARNIAWRFTLLDEAIHSRRINIGGPVEGYYLQLAANVFKNTTVRIQGEQTTFNRINTTNQVLASDSTAVDSRHGDHLSYILATNQVQKAASGPSGAGPIDNGYLNWSNVDSFEGWWCNELTVDTNAMVTVDTRWSDWLSTKVMAGYSDWETDVLINAFSFTAPNASTNRLPGNWTYSETAIEPEHDGREGSRTKALRFIAMATNDLFHGRAHSQSILGFDFVSTDIFQITYGLYKADDNWNVIIDPSNTTLNKTGNPGATPIPNALLNWTINQGPVLYPFFGANSARVILNGVKYVRSLSNIVQPQLISPSDPLGVTLGGDQHQVGRFLGKGLFGTNYTNWMDGNLTTLVGFRLQSSFDEEFFAGSAPPAPPHSSVLATGSQFNFNVGANYRLTSLLRPYFSISSSFESPHQLIADPYGNPPGLEHGIGQEFGLKLQNPEGTLSGSLAFYHVSSHNEQMSIQGAVTSAINPTGLNGISGNSSGFLNVNRTSEGVQVSLTAAPKSNWRMRFSAAVIDGKIGTDASFPQLYNDQFYANNAGQVTFKDGTVVNVPATFNAKTLTVPAGTAGAAPLTIAMLSDPKSAYYASPKATNAQITPTSAGGQVLLSSDPVHGPILTGALGLPISALQINPAPSGVTVPGTIVVAKSGDATTGYPKISANFTNIYEFPSGWLRGFELGGTLNLGWQYRAFYYYPNNNTGPSSPRFIFYMPMQSTFNLIAGYTHKFKRVTWHSHVNINNMFNRYSIVLIPAELTGFTAAPGIQATFSQPPRTYEWANRISF